MSTNTTERRSFQFRRSKRYLSTNNNQEDLSKGSFQMDVEQQNTRSTINLLSPK